MTPEQKRTIQRDAEGRISQIFIETMVETDCVVEEGNGVVIGFAIAEGKFRGMYRIVMAKVSEHVPEEVQKAYKEKGEHYMPALQMGKGGDA